MPTTEQVAVGAARFNAACLEPPNRIVTLVNLRNHHNGRQNLGGQQLFSDS